MEEVEADSEEVIKVFRDFSYWFKKAADVLEADNLRQHGIQPPEEQPKPYTKDKPQAPDWM